MSRPRAHQHLQTKGFLHLWADLDQTWEIAAFDLGRGPAGETNLGEGLANIASGQVVIYARDVYHFAFDATIPFDIQLHAAAAERPDPLARPAIPPVVAEVVVPADPGL